MRGAICFYSGSGNTALVCEYINRRLPVPFDLIDVVKRPDVSLEEYDAVGFATSTDFWGIPQRLETFIDAVAAPTGKPAFVLNTFGALSGKTLSALGDAVSARGFRVLGGHSVRMPESYPPMIKMGFGAENSPSASQIVRLDAFVSAMGEKLTGAVEGRDVEATRLRIGLVDGMLPLRARTTARDDMGVKHVDEELCTECGTCAKGCPYSAIVLAPKPVFDMDACCGCWRCYNRCPNRAIYTDKLRGEPFYAGPSQELRAKFEA